MTCRAAHDPMCSRAACISYLSCLLLFLICLAFFIFQEYSTFHICLAFFYFIFVMSFLFHICIAFLISYLSCIFIFQEYSTFHIFHICLFLLQDYILLVCHSLIICFACDCGISESLQKEHTLKSRKQTHTLYVIQ